MITNKILNKILKEEYQETETSSEANGYYVYDYNDESMDGPYGTIDEAARSVGNNVSKHMTVIPLEKADDGWYIWTYFERNGPFNSLETVKLKGKKASAAAKNAMSVKQAAGMADAASKLGEGKKAKAQANLTKKPADKLKNKK